MAETTVFQTTEEAYTNLRRQISQRKCRIVSEEAPNKISVSEGSIWGTTPQTAQKIITFTLQKVHAATRIIEESNLTAAYVSLTVTGIAFSVALLIICLWIALNLQAYSSGGSIGFWGWLLQTKGSLDPSRTALFIWLFWFLTAFLGATLTVEAFVLTRVKSGIDCSAKEIFNAMAPQK